MLNPITNQRELAYLVHVGKIDPIEGYDRIALAHVNGWTCVVNKADFKEGDLAVYFEIDSKVDETNPAFAFLAAKHYKIKIQKYAKGKAISYGLLMPIDVFGWKKTGILTGEDGAVTEDGTILRENDFVTERLKVTYVDAEDNTRKANSVDKYKKMAARHPKLFKSPIIRSIYRTNIGKRVLFVFFGKKKDTRGSWPDWVKKTDEERIQNIPWRLNDKTPLYATEKIDGTSTTFTMKRLPFGRYDFRVCSRNVVFDKPDKSCFYDSNVYLEMAEKYNIEETLKYMLSIFPECSFITIQGETYGAAIQRRDYGMKNHDFMAFNLIFGYKDGHTERENPEGMTSILTAYNIPCVPIVDDNYVLPDTVEELLDFATGKSAIDGGMREGIVFRSNDGEVSFKAVSPQFLLKYHS